MFQFRYPPELLAEAGYPESGLEWYPPVSPAVLVFCFLIIMFLFNMLPVKHLGQLEYIFGTVKMLFIILLIVLNVGLHIRQSTGHKAFWTYNDPYSFAAPNITLPNGQVETSGGGRLGAMWDAMLTCLFGMIGFETIAITAHENKDLRTEETIKIATRKISLRIITLYSLATFAVGLNVPYTYPLIRDTAVISFGYGQNSVFVISTVLNRLTGWPYFINDFVIFSATTAGANGIYNASRTLHALASIPDVWPSWGPVQSIRRRLEKTTYGVPHAAVCASSLCGMLGFLAASGESQHVGHAFLPRRNLLTVADSGPHGAHVRHVHDYDLRPHQRRLFGLLQLVRIALSPIWLPRRLTQLRLAASKRPPRAPTRTSGTGTIRRSASCTTGAARSTPTARTASSCGPGTGWWAASCLSCSTGGARSCRR